MTNQIKVTATDEIIVTSLRPMSEAPRDWETILCVVEGYGLTECYFDEDYNGWVKIDNETLNEDALIGWMAMPKYQPETQKD